MKEKTLQKISIAVFLGYIGVFSAASLLHEKHSFSENENRALSVSPSFSLSSLVSGKFDESFETWFSDQFAFRDAWIETKAALKKASLAIENNDVYFGKDGKLIRRFAAYPPKTLDQNISAVNRFLNDNDLKGNVLLVPTAADMDRNAKPEGAWDFDQSALLDQIEKEMPDVNFIRIDDELKQAENAYFRTDHHWNADGAYLGYAAICEEVLGKDPEKFTLTQVSDSFRGTMYSRSGAFWTEGEPIYRIEADHPDPVRVTYDDTQETDSLYSEKRLNEKDQYMYYLDGNHPLTRIDTDNGKGNTALVIKDSYAHILMPYLAREYEHIIMADLRYWRSPASQLVEDREHTDVYIIYSLDNFAQDPNPVLLR